LQDWNRLLRPYAAPAAGRSVGQLALSVALLVACFAAMLELAAIAGTWAGLPLSPVAGLLLVRLFIIQHDCGHHSFLRSRRACDMVGRLLGVLTMTPYEWWKRDHDRHHASSGDLSRRGHGDITTLTVREYRALSRRRRLLYRLYRHPLVLFGIGPAVQFVIRHRLPLGLARGDTKGLLSIVGTDAAILALFLGGGLAFGFGRIAALWLPAMAVAASAGVWMFFIQHQFEDTYWEEREHWNFVAAALEGCSYFRLPRPLEWLTASIGYHHLHHLASRIPNYRLRPCFDAVPALHAVTAISLRQSFGCARLALWCEERHRLLSFREALA
jgi:omega-6 fatty acid desaturase (delta-12 desaturase)